jgi:hypothetical protein
MKENDRVTRRNKERKMKGVMIKKGRKQKGTKWDNAKQNNKNIKEGSKTYIRETGTMRKATQEKRKGVAGAYRDEKKDDKRGKV